MIARAKEAGMESEKQQSAFWQAEELVKAGKLDEGKMTQVIALLMQSKYGKAQKILDEAASGVGGTNTQVTTGAQPTTGADAGTQSAQPTAKLEEVEIVGKPARPVSGATPAAQAAAPTIGASAKAAPTTLAQRVKASVERGGKLKRLETLLACLNRAK
jgi:hypothetical protein